MSNQRNIFLIGLVLVIIVIIAGIFWVKTYSTPKKVPEIHGFLLPETKGVPPFALQKADGSSFTEKNFMGHWNFVFFGYTNCPDICPMTLNVLNQAWQKLAAEHDKAGKSLTDDLQVVFISVDPSRDDLAKMQQYVNYFNPAFLGVTGNDKQLALISKYFGIVYEKVANKEDSADNYLVNHGSAIIIINPKGEYQGVFSAPHEAHNIATDFAKIKAYWE